MSNQTHAGEAGTAERVKDKVSHAAAEARDTGEHLLDEGRDRARHLLDEGRQKARELSHEAGDKVRTRADDQKDRVSDGMRSIAEALRRGSEQLPQERHEFQPMLNNVAGRVDRVSEYLDQHDVDMLTGEVRRVARDHTPLFLGGAFALGLIGARFLKSSGTEAREGRHVEIRRDRDYESRTRAERYDRMLPEARTPGTTGFDAGGPYEATGSEPVTDAFDATHGRGSEPGGRNE